MRTLGVLLAVLVALLPPCVACTLCQVEGGPCSPAFDACCDDDASAAGCADGMSDDGSHPCTCGEQCDDRDPATAGAAPSVSEIAPPPAPAGLAAASDAGLSAPDAARAVAEAAGPPRRLPLRI